MAIRNKAILWAVIIIITALFLSASELSPGASFGIMGGMSGAALGMLNGGCKAGGKCLM